jgi:hypothetical protein
VKLSALHATVSGVDQEPVTVLRVRLQHDTPSVETDMGDGGFTQRAAQGYYPSVGVELAAPDLVISSVVTDCAVDDFGQAKLCGQGWNEWPLAHK